MNIICAGFGGQGVLTAGLILGETAAALGKYVTWIPSYGSEMRGGTANCHLKISRRKISSPFIRDIDVLMAMNRPSLDKFQSFVRPGGLVISNRSLIGARDYPKGVMTAEVDATEIAEKLGNPKGANLAMLGALARVGVAMREEASQEAENEREGSMTEEGLVMTKDFDMEEGFFVEGDFLMNLELIQRGTQDFFARKGKENPKNKDCIDQAYEGTVLRIERKRH